MTSRPDGIKMSFTLAVSEAGRKVSPGRVESSLGMKGGSKAPEWPGWQTVAHRVHRSSTKYH